MQKRRINANSIIDFPEIDGPAPLLIRIFHDPLKKKNTHAQKQTTKKKHYG